MQVTRQVIVNGERREIAAQTVDALLTELDYEGTHFAIAVNFDVLPKSRWAETMLNSGDEIEIITPRQGG
jgi:sulfur carrier protein